MHPNRDEFVLYLHGEIPRHRVDDLEAHVEVCRVCAKRLVAEARFDLMISEIASAEESHDLEPAARQTLHSDSRPDLESKTRGHTHRLSDLIATLRNPLIPASPSEQIAHEKRIRIGDFGVARSVDMARSHSQWTGQAERTPQLLDELLKDVLGRASAADEGLALLVPGRHPESSLNVILATGDALLKAAGTSTSKRPGAVRAQDGQLVATVGASGSGKTALSLKWCTQELAASAEPNDRHVRNQECDTDRAESRFPNLPSYYYLRPLTSLVSGIEIGDHQGNLGEIIDQFAASTTVYCILSLGIRPARGASAVNPSSASSQGGALKSGKGWQQIGQILAGMMHDPMLPKQRFQTVAEAARAMANALQSDLKPQQEPVNAAPAPVQQTAPAGRATFDARNQAHILEGLVPPLELTGAGSMILVPHGSRAGPLEFAFTSFC